MEYVKGTEVSPLISKGVCKVCYVGQQPNRNHTVITKELAIEMGRKLPGSPVVGYYNESSKDFMEHTKDIAIENGKFSLVDMTKPYGFVPTNAKVWFQKFNDNGVEHEYLVTDVYIWTGAYPESQRVIEKGNNQSMELNEKNQSGFWTKDNNTNTRIFIYNEALIEKLCILGENFEPCFEGSQIKSQFSLENNPEFKKFQTTLFSMITELQETLSKGGSQEPMNENNDNTKLPEEDLPNGEHSVKKPEEDDKGKKKESETTPGDDKNPEDKDKNKKPEKKYNLNEVEEYTKLLTDYEDLATKYSALQSDRDGLATEVADLRKFKLQAERKDKQGMIDSFYMLSNDDKKDVIEHIDTYSLEDIEAKLAIVCVRNKVNFNLENKPEEDSSKNPQGLFNLHKAVENDTAPDWIKAVRERNAR